LGHHAKKAILLVGRKLIENGPFNNSLRGKLDAVSPAAEIEF
jgi:hypothetical protein